MRALTAFDAALVEQDVTSWAVCIKLSDSESDAVRLTSHDKDIEVEGNTEYPLDIAGTYSTIYTADSTQVRGNADGSVDNLEMDVLLDEIGITRQDIRAGIFNNVEFVLFLVNWRDPSESGIVLKRGVVGNIRDFLENIATFELRGFKQYLAQTITDAAGPTCRYTLGDANCGVNLADFQVSGEVTGVTSQRRIIETSLDGSEQAAGWYTGGVLTWSTGSNQGLQIEIKNDAGSGSFTFIEPVPYDISIGDTFIVTPGCNKSHGVSDGVLTGDCGTKYDNVINFGSEPFIPNQNALTDAPDR